MFFCLRRSPLELFQGCRPGKWESRRLNPLPGVLELQCLTARAGSEPARGNALPSHAHGLLLSPSFCSGKLSSYIFVFSTLLSETDKQSPRKLLELVAALTLRLLTYCGKTPSFPLFREIPGHSKNYYSSRKNTALLFL